ncbi:hypothetical protein BH10PSE2_BH10PSE2_29500 [soil metagenome]
MTLPIDDRATDDRAIDDPARLEPAFSALCNELGFCLHDKGQKKVALALPSGLDAAVKAVLDASGADFLNTPGSLKRQIRDCLKANLPPE